MFRRHNFVLAKFAGAQINNWQQKGDRDRHTSAVAPEKNTSAVWYHYQEYH